MEPCTTSLFQERKRLRELAKYYEAILPRTSHPPDKHEPLPKLEVEGFTPSLPCLAADAHLTALAQLAACRTGCQRCFISIIDQDAHHVVAEATRSISPFNQHDHNSEDGLLIGAQTLPLGYGICPVVFDIFMEKPSLPLGESVNEANKDYVTIADLRIEPETKYLPIIRQLPPVLRYCVAVPLRSDSGAVLGSICVIDCNAQAPDPKHVAALQQVARLVLQHMGDERIKGDHRRAERLLSGLAHFVRGQDSLSAWSETTPGQELIPAVVSHQARLSLGSLASLPSSASRHLSSNASIGLATSNHIDTSTTSPSTGVTTTPLGTDGGETGNTSVISSNHESDPSSETSYANVQASEVVNTTAGDANGTINSTFSRASNLIREAMDLDATTFLEVPHNHRFKNGISRSQHKDDSDAQSSGLSGPSTSDSESFTDSSDVSVCCDTSGLHNETGSDKRTLCRRLGFSTRLKSSLISSTVRKPFMTLSVSLLTRLTQRYPEGHIFNFDDLGSISSGDDEATAAGKPQFVLSGKSLASRLNRMFPDARSLIFLPLYDNDKQQLYAGFIGMTTSSIRALQKHESTYVAAFTNSLMCEVMRLEALTTDKAKSDFISSISHELRSPLHGILASSQLLAESKVQPQQREYVQMIDTCAQTLLDIMDHLLDHAKINQFTKQKEQRRQGQERTKKSPAKLYSLISSLNMLSVVEDTISSMAASSHQMLQVTDKPKSALSSEEMLTVPIVLDIPPHDIWKFDTEAGSWRRIIMNLVGNSLKYTQKGHITVSFRLKKQSDTKFLAELTIKDTGQGISEEYLKHRLYTPFAQENNLSVGVGLGLSLVNQIVASLRGDMRIFSEGGSGTEVSIKVPLKVSTGVERQIPEELNDTDLLAAMAQQTFAFVGLDAQPALREEPTGIPSPHMKAMSAMKASLSDLLTTWFKSRLVRSDANIVVVEESYLADHRDELDCAGRSLLIIGLNGRQGSSSTQVHHAAQVHVLAPIGPTKLASALKLLVQRQKESKPSAPPSPGLSISRSASGSQVTTSGKSISRPATPCSNEAKEAILLVDDNDINLRILVACVKRLKLGSVDLLTAINGKEALEKYMVAVNGGTRISVVFMDISMPVMDGFQTTRRIRSFEKKKGLTATHRSNIIALTGLASAEAVTEVEVSGFDSYLRKPVDLRTIREVLTAARL